MKPTQPPTVERIPAVLDVPGLARLLGMTEAGARALCRRGAIPARIPPGTRSYLVLGSDVLAWVQGGPRRVVEKRPDAAAHIRGLAAPRRRPRMRRPMASDTTEAGTVG